VRAFRVFSVAGVSGRRSTTISGLPEGGVEAVGAVGGLDARDVLGERDQPRTRKLSAARACAQAEPRTPRPRTATVRSRASGGADPARQTPSWPCICVSIPRWWRSTWPVTHSTMPSVRPPSTMRASGTFSVGLPVTSSTPAQRFRTALSRVKGVKSVRPLLGA
jgi:hypothetical protein